MPSRRHTSDPDQNGATPPPSGPDAARWGRRATIEDVARLAEVSVATVSRALRGLPNVAESTRARVTAAAAQLKYRPDPAASRLAARKTKTITVGVPKLNTWYFSNVVAGAEAVCNEAGYEFQVIAIGSLDARDRLLDDDHHLERRTDGLILVDIEPALEQAAALSERGVALATIGHALDGHPAVRIDDHHVGALAADHLLSLGHRRIGVINGLDDDPMNFVVPRSRQDGVAETLAAHGADLDPGLIAEGNFSLGGGYEAMCRLLTNDEPPTAVFAMSDDMAFGAMMAASESGRSVPDDVSIIGVDDHEFARVVGLTTIRQPVAEHGACAATLLMEAMSPEPPPADTVQPQVDLVVRDTTTTV